MDNHTTTARWSHEVKSTEEKKSIIRGEKEKPEAFNCPRCTSSHTKFCYYNNYNLSQPRYFCKTCRRYWTAGGSLRNVPVGGASRKNKLLRSSSSYDHIIIMPPPPNHDDDDQPPSQNPSSHHHHHIIQNHGSADLQQHQLHSTCSSMGFFKTNTAGNDYPTGMMMMNSFMPMPSSNPMISVDGFDQNHDDESNINHQDHTTRADHDPTPSTGARLFSPWKI